MKKIWMWVCYGLFSAAITALFLYILFPANSIRKIVELKLSYMKPDFSVSIGKLNPSLPLGLIFMDSTFKYSGTPVLFIKKLRMSTNLFTLFRSKTTYDFDASAYEGEITGFIDILPGTGGKAVSVNAALAELSLNKMISLLSISGNKVAGTLKGQLLYQIDVQKTGILTATLSASDFKTELDPPWMTLGSLQFKSVDTELKYQSQTLMIRQCFFKGPQLDGRISGS
ncbi:MAG: type II secretion system protein GspN, partial [Thermodesulfobacteriota bacterium]